MKFHVSVRSYIRKLLSEPSDELNRWQRMLRYLLDLVRHCARELHQDRAGQMAAALTYHTLFSLLPTVVLMLVVLQMFVGQAEEKQFRETTVNWILKWMEYDEHQPDQGELNADGTMAPDQSQLEASNSRREEFERSRKALSLHIQGYIDKLEQVNFKSIGVVGVLLFIYGATGLLTTIERSFNMIFGIDQSRPWYYRFPLYYTVITLGPLVLLSGQWLQVRFIDLVQAGAWTNWLAGPMVVISPLLSTWVVLMLMYLLLPNTAVAWRPAIIGSLVASVGWVLGAELFRTYVGRAAVASLYGALALLPLFLLWLYLTWLFVLFGLEMTYTLQAMRGKRFKHLDKAERGDMLPDPYVLMSVMTLVGRAFETGKPVPLQRIAAALSLPFGTVNQLSELLHQAGLIHFTEHGPDQDRQLCLSKSPGNIRVNSVMDIGFDTIRRKHMPSGSGREVLDRIHGQRQQAVIDLTLADVLAEG